VNAKLFPFLPSPVIIEADGRFSLDHDRPKSVGRLHPYLGNVGVILRAFAYLRSLGSDSLADISRAAIVNANYLMKQVEEDYPVAYPGPCMHEFVVSCTWMKKHGVKNIDVAKRLLDFGVHAPTVSFPLIVHDCLMIEPTESESRASLDEFAGALKQIAREAREHPEILTGAPHDTPVQRLDEGAAARNLVIRWEPRATEGKEKGWARRSSTGRFTRARNGGQGGSPSSRRSSPSASARPPIPAMSTGGSSPSRSCSSRSSRFTSRPASSSRKAS